MRVFLIYILFLIFSIRFAFAAYPGELPANTYPAMSKSYYDLLNKQGVHAQWLSVPGGTHDSVVISNTQVFDDAIHAAIEKCQ